MATPRVYRTYLFDLDGTLLDSIELIFSCYRHAASRHLETSPPDQVWRDGLGTPLREQFRAVTRDEALIDEMIATYREYHNDNHDSRVALYPGVEAMLSSLSARSVGLGVVTSKLRKGAERGLKLTGLMPYFDQIVSADEVKRAKPDPEPVHQAMERLGAAPASTIFIGDSPHDIAAGRAAGVATAGVLWGPFDQPTLSDASPTYLLEDPKNILDL